MLEFMKERPFVIIISIIWGLGLSCLFRQACVGRQCIEIKAPPPSKIVGKTYKEPGGERCFNYKATSAKCDEKSIKG